MKVVVILGSSRDGRMGERVSKLVMTEANKFENWDVELVDLAKIDLPMYHDANLPSMMNEKYNDKTVTEWSSVVKSADAFIVLTPEYNHSIPAVLKNAIDWLYGEWGNKAAGIVSYSMAPYGGARAVEHLRNILARLAVATVQTSTSIGSVHESISENGEPVSDGVIATLRAEFAQVDSWATALKTTR
ncbi:MAG: hypothetical protein QG628_303 [Patescibacteria group bacterium]|jgi:NAD(P)H-dependent FMN reductase|nr:hypothetical protein [Patescibacteria group bacterium]